LDLEINRTVLTADHSHCSDTSSKFLSFALSHSTDWPEFHQLSHIIYTPCPSQQIQHPHEPVPVSPKIKILCYSEI